MDVECFAGQGNANFQRNAGLRDGETGINPDGGAGGKVLFSGPVPPAWRTVARRISRRTTIVI
jgi:hypothetical protein